MSDGLGSHHYLSVVLYLSGVYTELKILYWARQRTIPAHEILPGALNAGAPLTVEKSNIGILAFRFTFPI